MPCVPQVDDWGAFDVFKVAGLTRGRPLEAVALAVLHRFDLVEKLQLPEAKLRAFLRVRVTPLIHTCMTPAINPTDTCTLH